jgi:DNA-binding NarL/FixJ family response regulator
MLTDDRIHVLIAHENPLVAAGLEAAFGSRQGFHVVGRRETGDVAPVDTATVLIADYERGTRGLKGERTNRRRVLILTDDDSEVSTRHAVELGISGYLPLSSGVETVVQAVRCIHSGGTAIAPNVVARIAMSLQSPGLSQREVEVLRLIMQGLATKAIARRLERTPSTAKAHIRSILMKLGASNCVEAVAIARRRGLVSERTMSPPSGSGRLAVLGM